MMRETRSKPGMTMRYPATRWQDALPTGSGVVGALVYGRIQRETILLNHDALFYPRGKPAAVDDYLASVHETIAATRVAAKKGGPGADELPLAYPAFPQAGRGGAVAGDTVPTYTYNWCVSSLTPMAVSGVIWVPSVHNLGETPADYAAELEIYAQSLPATYGAETVPFFYAHPDAALVPGVTAPTIPGAKNIMFDMWPKSVMKVAAQIAELVE